MRKIYLLKLCLLLALTGLNGEVFRVEYGYSFGDFIGINEDYQELGVFTAPYHTECAAVFFDGRGYLFNDHRWGASAGAGYRHTLPDECHVFGANIYYDYLEGDFHPFHELGLGFELLSPTWDFRVNGYYHLGANVKRSNEVIFDQYEGGFLAECRKTEYAFDKVDAEIGRRFCYCPCGTWVYLGLGPYYARRQSEDFFGGFFRAEVRINDIVSLEGRVSYDEIYKTRAQGRVLISIPLERLCCANSCCRDLLTEPVRREGVMFTDSCCNWTWNW